MRLKLTPIQKKKTFRNNSGKRTESEIRKSMKVLKSRYPHKFVRVADTNTFAVNYCPRCKKEFNTGAILQKQLGDFILYYNNLAIYIEVKSSKNKTSYPIKFIKPHQRVAYKELNPHGVMHYFFLVHRYKRGKFKLYVLESKKFDKLMIQTEKTRKSIPWEVIAKNSELVINRKHSLWELDVFFEYLNKKKKNRIKNIIKQWRKKYDCKQISKLSDVINEKF